MSGRLASLAAALAVAAVAGPARAHHGSAAVSAIGTEGPGVTLETTSPLPLGEGTVLALAKGEYVRSQRRAGFVDQKRWSSAEGLESFRAALVVSWATRI